jgi:NarL family two-component system response regulator LiaR
MEKVLASVGIDVVGMSTDVEEAVELIGEHRPDVFVAGVDVSSQDQMACILRAKEVHPDVRAIVVDDNTDPAEIDLAFAAGASAYCIKTATQDDLASAIRQLFERSIFLATHGNAGSAAPVPQVPGTTTVPDLTRREHEILRLVAEGYSNSQLAKMLWVTEQTVKFHLSNIYRKLDVANRTEASRWAQVHGLLPAQRGELSATAA